MASLSNLGVNWANQKSLEGDCKSYERLEWVYMCIYIYIYIYEKWYVYNIFTTNPKWQIVTNCYCWGKKVILALVWNLNQ